MSGLKMYVACIIKIVSYALFDKEIFDRRITTDPYITKAVSRDRYRAEIMAY